ncbi:hypothetical protein SALBM311S_04164 [Streptomyces alboniger]
MARSGRQPSQRELADHTGLEALYVSKLARSLEAAGLVGRARDTEDTRVVRLTLTAEGRAAVGRPSMPYRNCSTSCSSRSAGWTIRGPTT